MSRPRYQSQAPSAAGGYGRDAQAGSSGSVVSGTGLGSGDAQPAPAQQATGGSSALAEYEARITGRR